MKYAAVLCITLISTPLWVIGFVANIAWTVLASGWLVADEAAMDIYKRNKKNNP